MHDVIQTTTGQRLLFGFDLTTSICRLISLDLRPCQSGDSADVDCTTRIHTSPSGPPDTGTSEVWGCSCPWSLQPLLPGPRTQSWYFGGMEDFILCGRAQASKLIKYDFQRLINSKQLIWVSVRLKKKSKSAATPRVCLILKISNIHTP